MIILTCLHYVMSDWARKCPTLACHPSQRVLDLDLLTLIRRSQALPRHADTGAVERQEAVMVDVGNE